MQERALVRVLAQEPGQVQEQEQELVLVLVPGQVLVLVPGQVPEQVPEQVLAQEPPREQAWPLLPQELGWISWRAEWRGQE